MFDGILTEIARKYIVKTKDSVSLQTDMNSYIETGENVTIINKTIINYKLKEYGKLLGNDIQLVPIFDH